MQPLCNLNLEDDTGVFLCSDFRKGVSDNVRRRIIFDTILPQILQEGGKDKGQETDLCHVADGRIDSAVGLRGPKNTVF